MLPESVSRRTFVAGMVFVGTGAVCKLIADDEAGSKIKLPGSDQLGGAQRYLTFVSTDKPIYRVGDKIFVRGVILHHATRQPLPKEVMLHAVIEIIGPKGDTVASGAVKSEEGVIGFSWQVPDDQSGGEYTTKVSYPYNGHTPSERKFDIRAYRAPRLKTQIKFLRDGYGPGEEVVAAMHVERAEGGVPAGAKVTVVARIDDQETFRGPAAISEQGDCTARFRLPESIARGEGTLALIVEDSGAVETATKTIPILLQTVDLKIYPEGGELVAGLSNRVYIEALTPAKKPADIAGVIVDDTGKEVARIRSEHEGRGRCEFTPSKDGKYFLKINEPAGIKTQYPLPAVKATGAVVRSTKDAFKKHEPISVQIASTTGEVVATLSRRESVIARQAVKASEESKTVTFDAPDSADGVLTVTLWDSAGQPLAERLIFRQPARSVRVVLTPDAKTYSPGGKAKVNIKTLDEKGSPTSAIVGLTVTDDSVLEMIDKREQSPRLPVMVLLESEVRELADAHVYFDAKNEKSALAVDLLLGTQGWRRFALVNWQKFVEQHKDHARRALALLMPIPARDFSRARGGAEFEDKIRLFAASPASEVAKSKKEPAAPGAPAAIDGVQKNGGLDADKKPALKEEAAQLGIGGGGGRGKRNEQLAKRDRRAGGGFGAAGGIPAGDAFFEQLSVANDFVFVRIYAHENRPERKPGDRVDFTETLFWHAGLKTDEKGEASIEFALNDSVTTFRTIADAFSGSGGLGSSTTVLESVNPFYLEPKLPLEVTQGDRILVPVTCVNTTTSPLGKVNLSLDTKLTSRPPVTKSAVSLAAASRGRTLVELHAGPHNGPFEVTVAASAGGFSDKVTRQVTVRPAGFPVEVAAGGLIDKETVARHDIVIPADMVEGSFDSKIEVYPTPLAAMTQALEALIQEPCGCFEQTSSSVYPLVMAQQYFLSHQDVPSHLIEKSADILSRGYDRLRGFECKTGGFEWFGADPGHDALTAYGLMEFTDMSAVRPVDTALLERTRTWLLAQRDGKGTFIRKTHTYHVWLAEPEVSTAYNVWALLSAGVEADLSTEVTWLRTQAEKTLNTYVAALAANVMLLSGDKDGTAILLDKLAGKQNDDGSLKDATVSVIGSTGEALAIETTALAVLAWLKNPSFAANVEKGIRYLAEQCKAGRFGSTQSTILALKAIVAYDQARARPKAAGKLQLVLDGQPLEAEVPFDDKTQGTIALPKLPVLPAGKHTLEVRMTDGSQMPHSVAARFSRLTPDSAEACKLHLEVTLRDAKMTEGAVTEARVVVTNRSSEIVPTPTAIIGLPGGLEVRHDQLKELVKAGTIAAYEVLGREVVLYWRAFQAEARITLPLSLVAAIPGTYTGPASRAYLYYTNEHKKWVEGLRVEIKPLA
ncbi:MAG: MG2 domain-containing protein [Pirellulaceae bacterium]